MVGLIDKPDIPAAQDQSFPHVLQVQGTWSERHSAYLVRFEDLPFFLDRSWVPDAGGVDWRLQFTWPCWLAPSLAPRLKHNTGSRKVCWGLAGQLGSGPADGAGKQRALNWMVYVPPPGQRPLRVVLPSGFLLIFLC